MLKPSLAALLLWSSVILAQDNGRAVPTIDELIAIRTIRGATISPDGNWVAYTVRQADFEQDAYVNHIWLVDTETGESFQLTRGKHGEFDKRVPTLNAYELRQGLEDRGVPVEMIVYKGFGHGINKPKSQRAVMWHNLKWFNHYLWGDELPDLARPDIPDEIAPKEGT